jgi:hypothetical protein
MNWFNKPITWGGLLAFVGGIFLVRFFPWWVILILFIVSVLILWFLYSDNPESGNSY